jgi:hypothetical protein
MGLDVDTHFAIGFFLEPTLYSRRKLLFIFKSLPPHYRITEHQQVQGIAARGFCLVGTVCEGSAGRHKKKSD